MKLNTLLIACLLLFMAACKDQKADQTATTDGADTTQMDTATEMETGAMAEMDSAEMMKAWETFMTPGDMHNWMAKWTGTWTGDVSSFMDPEGPPSKSTATVTTKMIMNNLYQVSDYSGNMMGMPFQGHGILAYDNSKKEFVTTWIDNLGSGIVVMRGGWDEAAKKLSLKGTQTDPMTGKDAMIREEITFPDDNTQILTMWGEMHGKEMKFMEATFKRNM